MNLKNYFLAVALLTASLVYPYNMTMINSTNGELVVNIERARPDICAPLITILRPGQQRTVDSGLCCLGNVTIEKISGTNSGATYTYQTEFTNSDYSCKSSAIQIFDDLTNKRLTVKKI